MKKENDQYIEKIQNLSTEKLETEKKYQISIIFHTVFLEIYILRYYGTSSVGYKKN